ncbi:Lsr2 family DNA-binding protein [Rhodococcus opacus]|uniref:Lsr2 family DNA-binding protein n=1 Tax=Rhodococcus opacus TaxID=37919 RepID=UPI003BB7E2CC
MIEGGCTGSAGLRACGDHVAAETLRGTASGSRKTSGFPSRPCTTGSKWVSVTREVGSEAPVKTSPKEIREWAISEGHEVSSRGGFRPSSSEPSVMLR